MRTQAPRPRARRLALTLTFWGLLASLLSGALTWLTIMLAALLSLHTPPTALTLTDAREATLRLILDHDWANPAAALPTSAWRGGLPGAGGFLAAILLLAGTGLLASWLMWRQARDWSAGSPLARKGLVRWLRDSGHIQTRTWARSGDLRRLWVPAPVPGRPYLGYTTGRPRRRLAAEREMQLLLVAPPRSGKTTGYVIPWLLEHHGPAVVLSTKRDVHDATIHHRSRLGNVWVYDPFGDPHSCTFSPISSAHTWEQALRTASALTSTARQSQDSSAAEFWDREASMLIAPLIHAAAHAHHTIATVLEWIDTRQFDQPAHILEHAHTPQAAAQLTGVLARDPRNRETTIMSAANLLRAYRYPQVTNPHRPGLTPTAFLAGRANTVYVIAAAHHQHDLQPVILALVSAIYETAIEHSRHHGPFNPPLYMLLDETANIAPIRDLAPWLSQCGDHGITIATSWQSIAQIDHRYTPAGRDAILAASTAQIYIPPITDPTTIRYLNDILGDEPVTHTSRNRGLHANEHLTVSQQPIAPPQALRQTPRGHGLLIYRDLPPAIVRAPGWYERHRETFLRHGALNCPATAGQPLASTRSND